MSWKDLDSPWEATDRDLLDFLQAQSTPGFKWLSRPGTPDRGYAIHEHDRDGLPTIREAIRRDMHRVNCERAKAEAGG